MKSTGHPKHVGEEALMTIQLHSKIGRISLALTTVSLGVVLFATGHWAGSAQGGHDSPATTQSRGSFWGYDPQNGNPTGPHGQLDFWNYDPATGDKLSNYSAGIAPEQLAALWSGAR
jgi:hypothetical protein